MKTRFKDKDGHSIYGPYSYEGVVEIEDGRVVCTYCNLGECEAFPFSFFKKVGRKLLTEEQQRLYWEANFLGMAEPPEVIWFSGVKRFKGWKRDLYRNTPVP